MQTHRTTKCTEAGHREFTIQLVKALPVAGLEGMLLDYFEATVARGTKFLPGQTIQMGWSLLRVCERADGTLGVQERELKPDVEWVEQADRAIVDMWLQREVGDSVGLLDALEFPRQDDIALVAECGIESAQCVMTRLGKDAATEGFSGWMIACSEEHDHGARAQIPLIGVADMRPGLVQLLALPYDTSVLVLYREKSNAPAGTVRIEPHVFRAGTELVPGEGSYLAILQT